MPCMQRSRPYMLMGPTRSGACSQGARPAGRGRRPPAGGKLTQGLSVYTSMVIHYDTQPPCAATLRSRPRSVLRAHRQHLVSGALAREPISRAVGPLRILARDLLDILHLGGTRTRLDIFVHGLLGGNIFTFRRISESFTILDCSKCLGSFPSPLRLSSSTGVCCSLP